MQVILNKGAQLKVGAFALLRMARAAIRLLQQTAQQLGVSLDADHRQRSTQQTPGCARSLAGRVEIRQSPVIKERLRCISLEAIAQKTL